MNKDWEALSMHWEAKAKQLEARLAEAEGKRLFDEELMKRIDADGFAVALRERAEQAEAEAARYREALKIYAKPENWQPHKRQERVIWNWHPYEDGFKIAQAALAEQPAESEEK